MEEERLISDQDILEISLRIEREGKAFYKNLAKLIENKVSKDFLTAMAKEEAQHEKMLQVMLDKKGENLFGWENRRDLWDFIKVQFQTDIFPDISQTDPSSLDFETLQKTVDFAIEAELVSAEFYAMLGEYCDDLEAKAVLTLLEQAEIEHVDQVRALKEKLTQ